METTTTTEVKELVIDRKQWYRGNSAGSRLRRQSDGKMCCLGFFCLAGGLSAEELEDVDMPMGVEKMPSELKNILLKDESDDVNALNYGNSAFAYFAAHVNDKRLGETIGDYDYVTIGDYDYVPQELRGKHLQLESQREEIIAEHFAKIGVTVTFIN